MTCGRAEDGGEGDGGGVGGGGGGGGERGPVQQEPGVPPILHPGGGQRGDDALLTGDCRIETRRLLRRHCRPTS